MRCSHCGHENPGEFKFCGMCGNKLAVDTAPAAPARDLAQEELASTRTPAPPERLTPVSGRVNRYDFDRPPQQDTSLRAAEDFLRNRPQPTPPPVTPTGMDPEPSTVHFAGYESDKPSTEIHGPSFLGLSGSDDSSGNYLLEDEGGGSSAVRVVFLLILLAAAAVVWWKWEPIKTYVWTQASMHAQEAKPATSSPQTDATTADSTKPADSTAQSMPQSDKPQMSTDAASNPATPANAQPAQPSNASPASTVKPATESAKPADDSAKSPDDSSDTPAAKSTAPPDKTGKTPASPAAGTDEAATPDSSDQQDAEQPSPKPSAKKKTPPAKPQDDSAALLVKGENYLYGRGGVPQSCRQALVYFKAAADKQNPAALSHVGAMYATGECGVHVNRVQAYKWFSKAYELQPSNQYLERNLTMLWREMSDQERNAVTGAGTRSE